MWLKRRQAKPSACHIHLSSPSIRHQPHITQKQQQVMERARKRAREKEREKGPIRCNASERGRTREGGEEEKKKRGMKRLGDAGVRVMKVNETKWGNEFEKTEHRGDGETGEHSKKKEETDGDFLLFSAAHLWANLLMLPCCAHRLLQKVSRQLSPADNRISAALYSLWFLTLLSIFSKKYQRQVGYSHSLQKPESLNCCLHFSLINLMFLILHYFLEA